MKTFKTAFLLTALTLLLLMIGQAFGGRNGMTIALGFAIVMNGVAYFFSDKIALASSGARPISREEAPRLYAVMERLAAKANLPMPKLYLIPQAAPNAFATGRNPSHASVAVTQGLLELMNDDELEGVIAHELSHVRNYDILTSSIAATLAGAITWVARAWGFWFGGGEPRPRGRRNHCSHHVDRGTDRRDALAAWYFTATRISGGRVGRENGRLSQRLDQRSRKTRRVQQTDSHGHAAIHGGALHRRSAERAPSYGRPFQHAPSA